MAKKIIHNTTFPQFRRYKNGKRYFKIIATDRFEELEIFGSRFIRNNYTAKTYPDRLFIMDLLKANQEWVEVITGDEFKNKMAEAESSLQEVVL